MVTALHSFAQFVRQYRSSASSHFLSHRASTPFQREGKREKGRGTGGEREMTVMEVKESGTVQGLERREDEIVERGRVLREKGEVAV
ncbi:hypothetical protein IEQ34_004600 [Dendrobium chrysotoxum]|uniref:Uncharacterized protein n=1 Tax=Dendrobium chrysotoxum TaxID=161865 RepID=A0AAV7HGE8_DENCH|nr:hypothetical protein IEQ34_004600 [Dendrobium chrysotoxum]